METTNELTKTEAKIEVDKLYEIASLNIQKSAISELYDKNQLRIRYLNEKYIHKSYQEMLDEYNIKLQHVYKVLHNIDDDQLDLFKCQYIWNFNDSKMHDRKQSREIDELHIDATGDYETFYEKHQFRGGFGYESFDIDELINVFTENIKSLNHLKQKIQ